MWINRPAVARIALRVLPGWALAATPCCPACCACSVLAGETTAGLLWQLTHGSLPLPQRPPRLVVLLVGSRDLDAALQRGGGPAALAEVDAFVQRSVERLG